MTLKVENGQVGFYIRMLGSNRLSHDLMSEKVASKIISDGTVSISKEIPGFPLCVDGKYYFEASED